MGREASGVGRALWGFLLALALVGWGRAAWAADPLSLSVMLIEARKTGGEVQIDEELAPIAGALRRAYPEYQKFTLKAGNTETVNTGGSVAAEDPDTESKARATYKSQEDSRYVIAVKTWLKGKLVNSPTLKYKSGQVGFLTTFLDDERKRALITAILPDKA